MAEPADTPSSPEAPVVVKKPSAVFYHVAATVSAVKEASDNLVEKWGDFFDIHEDGSILKLDLTTPIIASEFSFIFMDGTADVNDILVTRAANQTVPTGIVVFLSPLSMSQNQMITFTPHKLSYWCEIAYGRDSAADNVYKLQRLKRTGEKVALTDVTKSDSARALFRELLMHWKDVQGLRSAAFTLQSGLAEVSDTPAAALDAIGSPFSTVASSKISSLYLIGLRKSTSDAVSELVGTGTGVPGQPVHIANHVNQIRLDAANQTLAVIAVEIESGELNRLGSSGGDGLNQALAKLLKRKMDGFNINKSALASFAVIILPPSASAVVWAELTTECYKLFSGNLFKLISTEESSDSDVWLNILITAQQRYSVNLYAKTFAHKPPKTIKAACSSISSIAERNKLDSRSIGALLGELKV